MCKVTMTDENNNFKICYVSHESAKQILRHFKINPETKDVYMNGKILSMETMDNLFPETGSVHLVVRAKEICV